MSQLIALVNAAKFFKAQTHQRQAFINLQQKIQKSYPDLLKKFFATYFKPNASPTGDLLVAIEAYSSGSAQNEALFTLQENLRKLKPEFLNDFAEAYRGGSGPLAKINARLSQLGIILPQNRYNLIGLVGTSADFKPNNNTPNNFNDLILIVEGTSKILWQGVGSTEPGRYYVLNPLNAAGAAYMKPNVLQKEIWQIGTHGSGRSAHTALVQTGNEVDVTRDGNKDFSRIQDKEFSGYYGINFHWGYGQPINNVSRASAGCQVVFDKTEHVKAMEILKQDQEYKKNRSTKFSYVLLYGNEVFK